MMPASSHQAPVRNIVCLYSRKSQRSLEITYYKSNKNYKD